MAETPLPPAVLDHLLAGIARTWSGRGEEAVAQAQAQVPRSLPEGEVTRLHGGGPFGWMARGRLDRAADGRLVLEVLEDSRMSGPDHHRVWEDGTVEPLENEHTAWSTRAGATQEEQDAAQERFYAHNHRVQALLRERGF